MTVPERPGSTGVGRAPDPADFWDEVGRRVAAAGTRFPAAEIVRARDTDRR